MAKDNRPFGRVEKRTYAGVMLEREFLTIAPRVTIPDKSEDIKPRFQSVEERKAHSLQMSRKKHVELVNANFKPGDLYLTFTFENREYPAWALDENGEPHKSFNRAERTALYHIFKKKTQNYIRRVQRKYENTVIFWYIGRGENSKRFHAHFIVQGAPEHFLCKKWGHGRIDAVRRLWKHCIYDGIDHGADYTALANYLFDHWEPEQGPHRYHHTRNAKKPDVEGYRPCRRRYSEEHPPKAPKGYKLVDCITTRYGYQRFIYVLEPGEQFLDFDAGIRKPKRSRQRRRRTEAESE